jgi:two-component system, LuxR family, sensor kinase FixL
MTADDEDRPLRPVGQQNAENSRAVRLPTEQQAQATLREQANLLNLTHDAILVRDMKGTIKYWNRGAEELYGWSVEQAVGKVGQELLKTIFSVPLEQIEAEVISVGRWEGELVQTRKDGSEVVVASRWSLQRDERSAPVAATVTNAQAALRWLRAGPSNLEEVQKALTSIVKDGDRAGEVINRIRAFINKAPPRKDRLEINGVILEIIKLTRGEAAKNGASEKTALGEGLPPIEGDRVQLQQVVLNLIVNAVQAMGTVEQGPRELFITTAQAEPNGVLVAVKDSGPGVAPASLEHLFAPFYTTQTDGLGMGLSICRSIIEAHGGRLWVTANLPRGAIFNFTLPTDPGSAS